MEFHTLTRRELQALCKKNKIPANITNAAMAEALKALETVEGIEEFIQPSQSETAESSIDSLEGSEVTSPYVPPTGGRTTRRRNVMKEEPEAVTTTRRTTRRTAAKVSHVDITETPALMSQISRRGGQMASACRKMDAQLKECVEEEEKKDFSMTPAPSGITIRTKKVEVGTIQKVYSTRRSVRLAEKNVDMLNDEKSEESELFTNELLTEDGENQEVNLEEDNELSGITGGDAAMNVENYESKEESEVISAEVPDKIYEGESCIVFEEAQQDEEISNDVEFSGGGDSVEPVNVNDEAKRSEGHDDVCTSEIETTVQKSEELDVEIDVVGDSGEQVLLESKDEIAVDVDAELCDEVGEEGKEIGTEDVESFNVALVKLTELKLQQEDAKVASPQIKVAEDIEEADSSFTNHLAVPEQLEETESDEMETVSENTEQASEAVVYEAVAIDENPTSKQLSGAAEEMETLVSEKAADEEQASEAAVNVNDAVGSDKNSSPSQQLSVAEDETRVVQPNKYSAMILSDNKENIGSGTKLVIKKEASEAAEDNSKNLNDLSLRKLTKMFKEQFKITKKSGNEALPRAALQAKN